MESLSLWEGRSGELQSLFLLAMQGTRLPWQDSKGRLVQYISCGDTGHSSHDALQGF